MAGDLNPFARRDSHSKTSITTYKVLTILSWLLVVVSAFYYAFHAPEGINRHHERHTLWGVNHARVTPFSLNSVIASIYWIVLFISQIGYVYTLFAGDEDAVNSAAGVGSHFVLNNLFQFAFIMLFVRGHFIWAEIITILNFANLSMLYFRHNTHPRLIHIPVVTGPLAWTFIALYWNGAIAVGSDALWARIFANVAIWGILVYGAFFLFAYKDYTIGFELSILTASLGVGQFFTKAIAFQWIFAFTIMAVLFVLTLLIAVPGIFGKEFSVRREGQVASGDQERAPLLDDN